MESTVESALLARVVRLERQNTRLWGSLLALAGLAGLGIGGQVGASARPDTVVEAKMFVLKDDAGVTRGEWVVDGAQGRLRLYGPDGKVTAELPLQAGVSLLGR
jgi:hypothetical protein